MTVSQAQPWIRQQVLGQLTVTVGAKSWTVPTTQLGLHAYLKAPLRAALARGRTIARAAGPGHPGGHAHHGQRAARLRPLARAAGAHRARGRALPAGRATCPSSSPTSWGRKLDTLAATAAIAAALRQPGRGLDRPADEGREARGHRSACCRRRSWSTARCITSRLFDKHGKAVRTLGVAVGQSQYPTPVGRFEIIEKQLNPWWYPPNSAWAAGEKPVPPGPGNPLGTRWMGHLGAGRRPARHARRRVRRLQRVARLHPHAHPGRRVAVRARARRQSRVDHPLASRLTGCPPRRDDRSSVL